MGEGSSLFTRRLRLFLRDFRMVEARAHVADGLSLVSYFANRRSYITLQDAHWTGTPERSEFALVRVAQVLWALAPAADVPVVAAGTAARHRELELQLEGGLLVRGACNVFAGQRLGDFLESAGTFLPVFGAHLLRSGRPPRRSNLVLGDIVLNQDAIQAVWEASAVFQHENGKEEERADT
jgi:hypothetical protein